MQDGIVILTISRDDAYKLRSLLEKLNDEFTGAFVADSDETFVVEAIKYIDTQIRVGI